MSDWQRLFRTKDIKVTPAQMQILSLFSDHKEGLSMDEIRKRCQNLGISTKKLDDVLKELIILGFLERKKESKEVRWFITFYGLRAGGIVEDYPWP